MTLNILLAVTKKEVREILSFALESRFGPGVIEVKSAKEAVEKVAQIRDLDLVVSEYPGIGDILFKHLASQDRGSKASVPCVVCCAQKPKEDSIFKKLNVLGYAHWATVIDSMQQILKPWHEVIQEEAAELAALAAAKFEKKYRGKPVTAPAPSEAAAPEGPGYCRIHTSLLIRVGPLQADVYIGLSPVKFLRLFREGDRFDEKDYSRYLLEKKLEYLYIRQDQCAEFIDKFKTDLLLLLRSEVLGTPSQDPDLPLAVHEAAQELLLRLGPTAEVQDVVKTSIQVTMKAAGRNPRLSQMLAKVNANPKRYIPSHSGLIGQISCTLAVAMEWHSETTFYKLNLAAFLHDITLDNHALAAIRTMDELNARRDQFKPQEYKDFQNHAMRAAELARQFNEVPPDVDSIIAQHHEQPDGSGFPRGLTHTHISPLGALFIVAHDLISFVFEKGGPSNIDLFLQEFLILTKDRYAVGNFKKIHKALGAIQTGE